LSAQILVSGFDGRRLLLAAPVLLRERDAVEERPTARDLLRSLSRGVGRLVILGHRLPDLPLLETLRRIRSLPATRDVSILVLLPPGEPVETEISALAAGANAVVRRPFDQLRLESLIAKLLAVPRRIEARIPVQGRVVGTPRLENAGHFYGLSRNISIHGMLLASPVAVTGGHDLELEFYLPEEQSRVQALGRVVRPAPEVGWPYVGYGVEFVLLPPEGVEAIATAVSRLASLAQLTPEQTAARIRGTIRNDSWIYEIVEPVRHAGRWQVEIRRGLREGWRPGFSEPVYVVEGHSPESALRAAREYVARHG
jgi:CheY-like chemotaxis protein